MMVILFLFHDSTILEHHPQQTWVDASTWANNFLSFLDGVFSLSLANCDAMELADKSSGNLCFLAGASIAFSYLFSLLSCRLELVLWQSFQLQIQRWWNLQFIIQFDNNGISKLLEFHCKLIYMISNAVFDKQESARGVCSHSYPFPLKLSVPRIALMCAGFQPNFFQQRSLTFPDLLGLKLPDFSWL